MKGTIISQIKKLDEPLFFITPDVKNGIGLQDVLPNYHVICSFYDPLIPVLRRQKAHIFCLQEEFGEDLKINNSGQIFAQKIVLDYIKKNSFKKPWIMYFKPSIKMDFLISKAGYHSIGNLAKLNRYFENKLTFYSLQKKHLPQSCIKSTTGIVSKLKYASLAKQLGLPFVIQFGYGWAGKTTFFIKSSKDFDKLVARFAQTRIKASAFVDGMTVLNNCCIYKDNIFISPPAIQVSGIDKLSKNFSVTCGRQWPVKFLEKKQIEKIYQYSLQVGKILQKKNYQGFFGLDFLIEKNSGRVYLSELNARLTASTSFYTRLELGLGCIPFLAFHIASFLKKDLPLKTSVNTDIFGSQVIFRLMEKHPFIPTPKDYGVYKISKGEAIFLEDSYYPEKLKKDTFIYMKRKRKAKTNEEISRLETKDEVLDHPFKLKSWLEGIIKKK